MRIRPSFLLTLSCVAVAVALAWLLWGEYTTNPWTRDAQVRADVVGIAAQVSGPIQKLAVHENQRVARGDLLYEIDPTDYQIALDVATAAQHQAEAQLQEVQQQFDRRQQLFREKVISKEEFDNASAQAQSLRAAVESARAQVHQARQNLAYCRVNATVNGYITSVNFSEGTYVTKGQSLFALVNADSFWVSALFKESNLRVLTPGRRVAIRFVARPDREYAGEIESVGWAIFRTEDGTQGLLPTVNPTIDWVRLIQRYPIRVRLLGEARVLPLRIGVTCSVKTLPGAPDAVVGTASAEPGRR